jgi:hypothetical protein
MVIAPPENGAPAGALITPMRMAIGYRGGVDTDFAHKMAFSPGQENDHSALWTRIGVSKLLPMAPGGASAYDSKRKGIWYTNAASPPYIRFLDISSQSRTQMEIKSVAAESGPDSLTMRYDSRRDIIIMSAVREDGVTYLMWLDCASPKTGWRIAKTSMPLPAPRYPAAMPFDIVPEIDKYCLLASADKAAVFEFELPKDLAMPWQVNRRTFTGLPSIPFAYVSGKRWSYVPAAKSFLWLAAAKGPLYAYRPAGT